MYRNLETLASRTSNLGTGAYLQLAHGPWSTRGLRIHRTGRYELSNTQKHGCIAIQRRYLTPGPPAKVAMSSYSLVATATTLLMGAGLVYVLYENDFLQPLAPTKSRAQLAIERQRRRAIEEKEKAAASQNIEELAALPFSKAAPPPKGEDTSAWGTFASKFESFTSIKDVDWPSIQESFADSMLPDWAKNLPENLSKLQRELSMAPGSLADEIWKDARNPEDNPEIIRKATVRVSQELCDEEKEFLKARKVVTTAALAKYLDIPEEEVNPADVPNIAIVGSGGGIRAMIAGTGSLLAAHEAGLFDCVTYTAGVSGSCWLQALYHSSLGGRRFDKMVNHLKARLGIHIAYPPVALQELNSAPTNKFLLSGFVEKLKGDPKADFGIVDLYGLLLAARLLVPKGELGVDNRDLKISNQRASLKDGKHPMPIYTAVRHEIPIVEKATLQEKITGKPSEETKEKAKKEAWFQWFEISPYEMFCEEFSAGIPTWAMGRKFKGGEDIPQEDGLRVPELKLPLLLGVFGSAMCATLSHYAREIRPIIKGILPHNGFNTVEEMMQERNEDLSKVHPIEPASIPNFCLGMQGRLPETAPESISKNEHLQLMDAGMVNNLPMYSCIRPGRDIDIIIAFDSSADIKTENWLQVTEGYALQRGIKGWPIGAGWPRPTDTPEKAVADLHKAESSTVAEAEDKLSEAKADHEKHVKEVGEGKLAKEHEMLDVSEQDSGDLGYCSVWVGTTQERGHTDPTTMPKSKNVAEDWQLMQPDAGIAVIYFPFLPNDKVAGVDPVTSPYMSTWNFIYTPEDVENVVALAKANFEEGREQTRRVVRAVYERKKKLREAREYVERVEVLKRKLRLEALRKKKSSKGHDDHIR